MSDRHLTYALWATGLVAVLPFTSARAQCVQTFDPAANIGGGNRFVVTGDFNADGVSDRAYTKFSNNAISVFLGNANGTFGVENNYATGAGAAGMAVGDFNNDGRPDLAIACSSDNAVRLLLSNPNGTFVSGGGYATGNFGSAHAVGAGDFNSDGQDDIAVANYASDDLAVLLSNPGGTYNARVLYPIGDYPQSVAVTDFNGDGRPDIAVLHRGAVGSGLVTVLRSNANGTFQAALTSSTGGDSAMSVAVGDLNLDTHDDLAIAHSGNNSVSILRGTGTGTFMTAVSYTVISGPVGVTVGDFNADGRMDVASANSTSNTVSILRANSTGTFQPAVHYPVGAAPVAIATGNFRVDGRPDLVTAATATSLLLNSTPIVMIVEQPEPTESCLGAAALFDVAATGQAPLTYLWQIEDPPVPTGWRTLANGLLHIAGQPVAVLSGVTTPSLSITPSMNFGSARFRCTISNACGSTASHPATLTVTSCSPPCDGDANCDFALDGLDVEVQEKAVGGDITDYCQPDPDFNGDFALDGFDVESVELVVGGGPCP